MSTSLTSDVDNLLQMLDLPDNDIERSLHDLWYGVAFAVPSFVGLSVTVVVDEQPVVLTYLTESSSMGSSLELSLSLTTGLAPGSRLVLYAVTPGAFVDLAADLGHVLGASDEELVLDRCLVPLRRDSGIVGVEEMSMTNRAVGILVGRGHTPEAARDLLRRKADQSHLLVFQVAGYLISMTE
jgi:hypothetical protein